MTKRMARLLRRHSAGTTVLAALWGVPTIVVFIYLAAERLTRQIRKAQKETEQ